MTKTPLHILLIEDDEETLEQLRHTLEDDIREKGSDLDVRIDACQSFDEGLERIKFVRYDLIISDIYQGTRSGRLQRGEDARAFEIVDGIRGLRFSPILLYTSSSRPEGLEEGPFLGYVDKGASDPEELVRAVLALVRTELPLVARKIHDEMDSSSARYIWEFLDEHYTRLKEQGELETGTLERLLRRRLAVHLGRLTGKEGELQEIEQVAGIEYYITPKIAPGEYRLGEIIRQGDDYRVILTPHCHLAIQAGQERPKADYVLTVKTIPADQVMEHERVKRRDIGQAVRGNFGRPKSRYWFLPRLLDMQDRFCDLMQVESLEYETLNRDYEPIAVLDTPYAESLQASYVQFYSSVGTPNLDPEEFAGRLFGSESS